MTTKKIVSVIFFLFLATFVFAQTTGLQPQLSGSITLSQIPVEDVLFVSALGGLTVHFVGKMFDRFFDPFLNELFKPYEAWVKKIVKK